MTSSTKPSSKTISFWSPLRIVLTIAVLSLIAIAGVSSCTSSDEKSNSVVTTTNAPPAKSSNSPSNAPITRAVALPANVREASLKTVSGSTMKLSDYSGKVVLVNLWATWCGPCRMETPELVRLHKEYQSKGVEMIGLSTEDPEGSADSVKSFVEAFKVDYHVGWAPPEVTLALYQVAPQQNAIPQSFIISREGVILRKFIGFNQTYTPPQIRQALEDALNYKG